MNIVKNIKRLTFLAFMLAMLLTVVSCASKNSDKLFNDKILEIESTSTKLDTKGNNIISLDAKKNVLLSKEESGKTTYTLYNADSQSVIAESEYAFEFTKPNLYILKTPSSDNTATEYNFYTESGLIKNISVPNSSNVNNYFVVDTDESIRFSDGSSIQLVNGEAYKFFSSGEGNSPAPQFSTDDVKAGRFYYDVYNNCVSVFDSDKNFLRFTDVAAATGYNNDDIHFCGNIEEKLVFQVNINIPNDSKKYSYFVDSNKYDLITYTYNLKNGKIEEKKNFDFIIDKIDYIEDYSKCGLAYGYYINDAKTISSYIVQAFDDGLDVAVDIQAMVPGACEIYWMDEYKLMIDGSENYHIFKGKDEITFISGENSSEMMFNMGSLIQTGHYIYYDSVYSVDGTYLTSIPDKRTNTVFAGNKLLYTTQVKNDGEPSKTMLYIVDLSSGEKTGSEGDILMDYKLAYTKNDDGTVNYISLLDGTKIADNAGSQVVSFAGCEYENEYVFIYGFSSAANIPDYFCHTIKNIYLSEK